MKKFLLFACIVFTAQLTKAQFHQDSIYFFMKLKNPKASFTINKPKMKNGFSEYVWGFFINSDNNQCTGNTSVNLFGGAPQKRFHGDDINIMLSHTYYTDADTTGPITVTLANKTFFSITVGKYTGSYYSTVSTDLTYRFAGDSGIFIVAFRNDTAFVGLDDNDDYFARTIFKYDTLTTTYNDINNVRPFSDINMDMQGDAALDVVDLLGTRIYNANAGIAVNNTYINGTANYDSAGTIRNLIKGKARFYSEGRGGDVSLVALMDINNGSFSGYAPAQGRYRVIVVPDSFIYNLGILPTYYGNTVFWNNATTVDICRDSTMTMSITLKRVNVNLTGPNSIQGFVLDGNGPRKPGEPKRGAGVALEQIPGGSVAYKTTDDNGFYDIQGLDPGVYKVTVNLPGKDMKAAYTTTLSASAADVDTAVFFANDTLIYTEDTQLTIDSAYASFGPEKRISQNVSIYPNPSHGMFYIVCQSKQNEIMEIVLVDLQGREVYKKITRSKMEGETKISVDYQEEVTPGYYLLKINQGEQRFASSIVIK